MSKSLFCACDKWKANIDAATVGTVFMANRGLGEYEGEKFKYCPWCGSELGELIIPDQTPVTHIQHAPLFVDSPDAGWTTK